MKRMTTDYLDLVEEIRKDLSIGQKITSFPSFSLSLFQTLLYATIALVNIYLARYAGFRCSRWGTTIALCMW